MSRSTEDPLSIISLDGVPKTPYGVNVYVTPGKVDAYPGFFQTPPSRSKPGSPDEDNPRASKRGGVSQDNDTTGASNRRDITTTNPQTQFKFILRALIGLSAEETKMVIKHFGILLESKGFSFSLEAWKEMNIEEGKPLRQISIRRLGGLHKWYSLHSQEYYDRNEYFMAHTGVQSYEAYSFLMAQMSSISQSPTHNDSPSPDITPPTPASTVSTDSTITQEFIKKLF